MTVDEIKELIQIVNESGIAELEVQRGDNRVRIRRATPPPPQEFVLPSAPLMTNAPVAVQPAPAHVAPAHTMATALPVPLPAPPRAEVELVYVKSPIVGTFY